MNNKTFYSLAAVLIFSSITFWTYMFQDQPGTDQPDPENEGISLTMYHSEGCECCVNWAEYLTDHGVTVESKKVNNIQDIKEERGIPNQLSSCHTAVVDGYVVEGHVPVEDIRRMLAEQPDAIGIAAPGMPPNSPGMDQPVENEYQIVMFDGDDNHTVYNTHK